jgi:hypothetical protein
VNVKFTNKNGIKGGLEKSIVIERARWGWQRRD